MSKIKLSTICATSLIGIVATTEEIKQPNIITILADDMGFSDIGCFGGEIDTPNIDKLAKNGLRFTQFYNSARCCPSRASLLTGLYPHQAGIGDMNNDEGPKRPGYRGRIMPRAVTIGEVLQTAGYYTITTGKWHGGHGKGSLPVDRGFDRSYVCPEGGGFYFTPASNKLYRSVILDNKLVYDKDTPPPKGWYSTDAWVDEGLKFVKEAKAKKKPFFWYLAHNAPHFPLQAKPEDIAKYRGKYMKGWDKLRVERYNRLVELGIIDKNFPLSKRASKVKAWADLSEKQKDMHDFHMATYAACMDSMDQSIGRLVDYLKSIGEFDNTIILFLSDNGACNEGGIMGSNKGKGVCGTAESNIFYGQCWANLSNTPFRMFKKNSHEGGVATPLVVHWPNGIRPELNGSLISDQGHLIDLMTTFVDISSAKYPKEYKGHQILPMEGVSLKPIFEGKKIERDEPIFFEHIGHKGIRLGDWKLVSVKSKKWELYNMKNDRTEQNDLAKQYPELVKSLSLSWDKWADRCYVKRKPKKKK